MNDDGPAVPRTAVKMIKAGAVCGRQNSNQISTIGTVGSEREQTYRSFRGRRATGLLFLAREEHGGLGLVEGTGEFEETALFGDTDGGDVVRVNDAERARRGNIGIAPSQGGADRFGGIALAVNLWSEHPAELGHRQTGRIQQNKRWLKFALVLGVTEFANELA